VIDIAKTYVEGREIALKRGGMKFAFLVEYKYLHVQYKEFEWHFKNSRKELSRWQIISTNDKRIYQLWVI